MRGSRVTKGAHDDLQQILDAQEGVAGLVTIAGWAAAQACNLADDGARNLIGRVRSLRVDHDLTDRDILLRLDPPPHGSMAIAASAIARTTGMAEDTAAAMLANIAELRARRYRDVDIVRRLTPARTIAVG